MFLLFRRVVSFALVSGDNPNPGGLALHVTAPLCGSQNTRPSFIPHSNPPKTHTRHASHHITSTSTPPFTSSSKFPTMADTNIQWVSFYHEFSQGIRADSTAETSSRSLAMSARQFLPSYSHMWSEVLTGMQGVRDCADCMLRPLIY